MNPALPSASPSITCPAAGQQRSLASTKLYMFAKDLRHRSGLPRVESTTCLVNFATFWHKMEASLFDGSALAYFFRSPCIHVVRLTNHNAEVFTAKQEASTPPLFDILAHESGCVFGWFLCCLFSVGSSSDNACARSGRQQWMRSVRHATGLLPAALQVDAVPGGSGYPVD